MGFRLRGAYLESCNCEPICPCRTIGGVPGGRSTYGECYGVLTWRIEEGHADDLDLGGLAVSLIYRYDDDDEEGSPWTLTLHVDERADEQQRSALERVFLDELRHLPWIRKARHAIGVRASAIEAEDGRVRIGCAISLRAERDFETDQTVTCIVPGHDRLGRELIADELVVEYCPFTWELSGNCAYTATFDYRL
ncbi:MAG TPA: DUF1326 domain-containing protein [Gaiellaceae bacterium]|nr:DUF1326 domain-containing protein [Gaiellaceae bacterium]